MFKRSLCWFIVYLAGFVLLVGGGGLVKADSDLMGIYVSESSIQIVSVSMMDSEVMSVRVMSPADELVVDREVSGSSFTWGPGAGDPDGLYRYEAQVVDYSAAENADRQKNEPSARIVSRISGTFSVEDGMILVPEESSSEETGRVFERQSFWQNATEALTQLSALILETLVPSVYAADLEASGPMPFLRFDDTDTAQNPDWHFAGYGDEYGGFLRIFEDGTELVLDIQSSVNNTNSFVVDDSGDIHFANDGMFFDRSSQRLGIGTITPAYDLHVASGGQIFMDLGGAGTVTDWWINPGGIGLWFRNQGSYPFRIDNGSPSDSLVVAWTGNVGVGTGTPVEAVDVYRTTAASRFQLTSVTNTANEAPQFVQRRARLGPSAVQSADNLGLISFRGYNGSTYSGSRAIITALAAQNWSASGNGTRLLFGTTPIGSTSPNTVMEITHDSKVKINGIVLNVPDYVFEDDYKLMPLDDLMAYVKKEKRLPNIFSAADVKSEGLDLGGSQMAILEKVEELTLYTLKQHEQLKQQAKKISVLQDENNKLREQLEARLQALEELVK